MPTIPDKPMNARDVLDAYFLETRAKLIEVAANLDRVDRAPGSAEVREDERLRFVRGALEILRSGEGNRTELIQRLYSKDER
ncbi:MAG: hypothetical protein FWD53_08535 [Phycisphaerales bacterium]|nr:hypothetical protein [Phycisphaerales bacterium]